MDNNFKFNVALKKFLQEGTLAWEYNPFRNYRLNEDMIYYKNKFYTISDFKDEYIKDPSITYDENNKVFEKVIEENKSIIEDWSELGFSKTEEIPVVYQKGLIVDLITDEFEFDLNHPVLITPTYSYDNSVDLIINDGKSSPKIINSRFSAIGKNKYLIIDRVGNNDTNIYDKGDQFNIDTSLYKVTSKIPSIAFGGESYGGNLKVGNYHFYFKYVDLDGNESDYVGLSGLVSVFLGNTPNSINSGFRDQNSNKRVRFILKDIDEAYDYIKVYYTRATSLEYLNRTVQYVRIELNYKISSGSNTVIDITGFETIKEVSDTEINQRLQIYDSVKTLAVALNMLFLGNPELRVPNHELLSKIALHIIPSLDTSKECKVNELGSHYGGDISNTYYDPKFIYKYTGYWDDEIYRFGIVFIRSNNTLTPVYNVRGLHLQNLIEVLPEYDEKISYDETTYIINDQKSTEYKDLENAKGVCYIPKQDSLTKVIGITFKCHESVITKLKGLGIKGYFIVRLKRIPTTLCQAYTIGVESESHVPMLPLKKSNGFEYKYESFLSEKESTYVYWEEGDKKFDEGYLVTLNFKERFRSAPEGLVYPKGAICPDYDVNLAYLNTFFTGSDFVVIPYYTGLYLEGDDRLYTTNSVETNSNSPYKEVKIIGVEDNVKLVGIKDDLFSARAGEAEEAFRFESVGPQSKEDKGGSNLVRGSYGNYLGISGYDSAGDLITIKIPGYNPVNLQDYFKIRYDDTSMFYPISDRFLLDDVKDKILGTCYRGDCYICKFTHRLNRNFVNQLTPTNDEIVDPATWCKNIEYEDNVLKTENLDKINLGDINAVNIGVWATFILRSNINHSVRSLDESHVDEAALMGNARGFFPYHPISARSAYKIPESATYNKGFEASVGEQIFEELPIVPYYKNVFPTRVAYSNILITSAFKNAYRVFPSKQFRDYPITYGELTKLIEWDGNLICVLEHGIYKIPVNERTVAGQGSGGNVYINTSNVLPENPIVISDTYGSLWIDSIIKTPIGIYGVDTVAKKIWKVDDSGIELISDKKVLEFLNKNITFTERELTPIIGIKNVKTHYNAFKHDVMFTFYDNLHGVDEVVWNLCWNETNNKWITFYSWIPSFSENIYNSYFSFDRETSKLIAKLSLNESSEFNDYIYLDNSVMNSSTNKIGTMKYDLKYEGANVSFKWEIIRDPYLNYKHFSVNETTGELSYNKEYNNYINPLPTEIEYDGKTYTLREDNWVNPNNEVVTNDVLIKKLNKLRILDWKESFYNNDEDTLDNIFKENDEIDPKKVYMLNIRVTPTVTYEGTNSSFSEYIASQNANALLAGGYIERTIAVIPKEHIEALSTDFWKHGQAGIIDIKEEIKPTKWYGELHPFEFEFIVRDKADVHKIFDNLVIISNKAEPQSFHYEVVGECYEFAKDKKNMYIRLEATKELFQNSGYDITYNSNYKDLPEEHRKLIRNPNLFDKSTIFPAYYYRRDSLNTVLDYYHIRSGVKDSMFMTGAELVYYKDLDEFRIWNHTKAINMDNDDAGYLKGNMLYKEDRWFVLIPSINLVLKNEPDWSLVQYGTGDSSKIPIELQQSNFIKANDVNIDVEPLDKRGIVFWNKGIRETEAKVKDKYVKIRVRYSGKDLAVISAIKTLYSISYA